MASSASLFAESILKRTLLEVNKENKEDTEIHTEINEEISLLNLIQLW